MQGSELDRLLTPSSIRTMKPIRGAENSFAIQGQAFASATHVEVRWAWLVFLVFQVLLSLVFLVYTIVATEGSQIPVLKSSARATLLALDERARAAAEVEGEARGEHVKLQLSGERLLLAEADKG